MKSTLSRVVGLVALTGTAALAGWSVGHGRSEQPVGNVQRHAGRTPVEVRTEVIHKTVHVRRKRHHRRSPSRPSVSAPSRRRHVAAAPSAPATAAAAPPTPAIAQRSAVATAPPRTRTSGSSGPSHQQAPVRTRTSGSGGGAGGGEREHESEHESEGGDD